MKNSLKEFLGFELWAEDNHRLGRTDDVYFDDSRWTVRYWVVDTHGWWPAGRRMLVSPASLSGPPDWINCRITTRLTRDEIRSSPEINLDQPISRREEENLASYFRWPAYWTGAEEWTGPSGQILSGPTAWAEAVRGEDVAEEPLARDYHLHSLADVLNYRIETPEGESGSVDDFIFDDEDWMIRYLVADTGTLLLPGKKVLIPPRCIDFLDEGHASVITGLNARQIQGSPEFDPSLPWSVEMEQRWDRYFQAY